MSLQGEEGMMDDQTVVVPASTRLTKCSFINPQDFEIYPPSIYTCPRCREEISFVMRDLDRHSRLEFSNLSRIDADAIVRAVREFTGQMETSFDFHFFIDFYCNGCGSAVRIYYWGNVVEKSYGYGMTFVVEHQANRT